MLALLLSLLVSLVGLVSFIVLDAKAAFDGNEATPTLSSKIKAWRHRGHTGGRSLALATIIAQGALALGWLFGHLILELW